MFLVGLLYWLLKLSNMFSYWSSAYFSLQLMLAASALHYMEQVFLVSGETFSHINPRNTSMEFHLWSLAKLTVLIIITGFVCFQINWSSCSPPPSLSWPQAPESWWLKPVGLANILFPSKSSLPSPLHIPGCISTHTLYRYAGAAALPMKYGLVYMAITFGFSGLGELRNTV